MRNIARRMTPDEIVAVAKYYEAQPYDTGRTDLRSKGLISAIGPVTEVAGLLINRSNLRFDLPDELARPSRFRPAKRSGTYAVDFKGGLAGFGTKPAFHAAR
jgi:hypothetical protein